MKRIVYFFILLVCSCAQKTNKENGVNCLDVFGNQVTDLAYDSIKLVALESDENRLLGDQLKIKLVGDEIFIADMGVHKCIFRYNQEGVFLNKIGKAGRGPQEYFNLGDFIVHGDTIDILSGEGTKSSITGYLKNGDFLYSKSIGLVATSFEKLNSEYLFFTGHNKAVHKHRMYIADEDGTIKGAFLPHTL